MTSAKIIADSISPAGKRITTFELIFPRIVLCEFGTHRVFSRNSSSSRAIPVIKQLKQIWSNPFEPIFWGKNCAGMGAKEELLGWRLKVAKFLWRTCSKVVVGFSWLLSKLGGHKEWTNRLTEPWSYIKVVATATELDNFFHLRCHKAAQPEIRDLAQKMLKAYNESEPEKLQVGEWHLPYISRRLLEEIGIQNALKISLSLCAQTSYRTVDDTLEKAEKVVARLMNDDVIHASPSEHQAQALENPEERSGNFIGWMQYRQTIPNNVCKKFDKNR